MTSVTHKNDHSTTVPATPAAPFVTVTTTCETITVSGPAPTSRVVLTFSDGSTQSFAGDSIGDVFGSTVTVNGAVTGGTIPAGEHPGLTRVDVESGTAAAGADMPDDCDPSGPIGGEPHETDTDVDVPPPDVVAGPGGADRPDRPERPEPNPNAVLQANPAPRVIAGPPAQPPVSELPATGADVPTQMMAALDALMLGLLLLTRTPRTGGVAAAADAETLNGFRRPSRSGDLTTHHSGQAAAGAARPTTAAAHGNGRADDARPPRTADRHAHHRGHTPRRP